jgi:hypothetical protein
MKETHLITLQFILPKSSFNLYQPEIYPASEDVFKSITTAPTGWSIVPGASTFWKTSLPFGGSPKSYVFEGCDERYFLSF